MQGFLVSFLKLQDESRKREAESPGKEASAVTVAQSEFVLHGSVATSTSTNQPKVRGYLLGSV